MCELAWVGAEPVHQLGALFVPTYSDRVMLTALGGKPPVSRTRGSDFRITADRRPEPVDLYPVQLSIDDLDNLDDLVEPTS